ncbi:MAG: heparinase II/III family protein [Pirellulales bacterium]|nr:heparinase II/III family protein [Pirellulales bacterium]
MFTFTLLLLTAVAADPSPARVPAEAEILHTLRPEHPRLIATSDDLARLKKLIAAEPRAAEIYRDLKSRADKLLDARDTVEYKIVGPRLLSQSRKCVDRVYTLATLYRIDGDRRYAERALKELTAAAAFKDWNPSHFLDTAEMTHAFAIGYDWLHDVLSPEQKQMLRRAIVEKGLRAAEPFYREQRWWTRSRHNWNQVCNGGITLGALAVAEDEPQLAAYIVYQAAHSVQLAMDDFAPAGAWAEGPGYWNYATRYNAYMLAGLETALGTDFGLSRFPGFSVTGDFRIHTTGPTNRLFNFADGGDRAGQAAQVFYLARKFDNPLYAWHERERIGGSSALHLWWFDPRGEPPTDFSLDRRFPHVDVVCLRSRWNDPRAVFVGFKGGDNKVNHSHLELGTFVLDADGQRWVYDVGSDDYNLPGYFGSKRWTYNWLATAGQNTLLIDGKNQDPKAVAPIAAFRSTPSWAGAVADLSAAYANQAKSVRRGIALIDRREVLVQDELEGTAGAEIAWQVHTKAKTQLEGDRAVLRRNGETLIARILSPDGAAFAAEPASPPPPQRQQPDASKLFVKLPGGEGLVRVAVLLTPGSHADDDAPALKPLDDWGGMSAR